MYNGHKNWNHWNVCLWIYNDDFEVKRLNFYKNVFGKKEGARNLFNDAYKGQKTPDGAPYSISAIYSIM